MKCTTVLVALLACLAGQARATSRLLEWASSALEAVDAREARHSTPAQNGKAYPLIEFKVPPQHEEEFVNLFRTVHEIVEEKEPEVKYSLSRQTDGNLIWYIYGEFASVEDYNKHASQQYEHDFYNGINKLGIVWESHLLQPVLG